MKLRDENEKKKAILGYVIRWLDSNIDDAINKFDPVASDSADLKEKIELALDPRNTTKDIEAGNF
tara:strand:- start:239 stop:433 length:195 start_codon:yes stop_codon:yes gene_type:complete